MDAMDTDEPDEFARLLAQLNATPAPAPVDAAPAAAPPEPALPVFAPPPAPAMPAPVMPAPVMPAPVMPAPVMPSPAAVPPTAAQISVAPAFGAAAPYPTLAVAPVAPVAPDPVAPAPLTFPTVAPLPVDVAPVAPPLPRAPELMGADELAAPPRSLPAYDDVPPLVSPPAFDAPPAYDPPPAYHAPSAQQPPQAFSPPPSAPAPSPSPVAAPAAVPAPAPRAPLDFASLLSTPAGADGDARASGAPLTFASGPQNDDDEPDLGRSTAGEKIGLVLAILVAPIGLIVGIVAAIRSANRRGWVVGIVRASIAIAVVFTVVLGIGGYFGYTQFKLQQAHDQTAAASAAFCAAIKATPSMDQLPTFGWPAVAASIPESLKAMQAYEDRWVKLAKVSPAGIKPGVTRVAAAAKKIIDSVTVARTVDDASNVATMSSVASSSGVPEWHSEYCG